MAPRERLRRSRRGVVLLLARGGALPVDAAPEGQLTWTSRVTVVPAWFDPGEASVGSAPAARAKIEPWQDPTPRHGALRRPSAQ